MNIYQLGRSGVGLARARQPRLQRRLKALGRFGPGGLALRAAHPRLAAPRDGEAGDQAFRHGRSGVREAQAGVSPSGARRGPAVRGGVRSATDTFSCRRARSGVRSLARYVGGSKALAARYEFGNVARGNYTLRTLTTSISTAISSRSPRRVPRRQPDALRHESDGVSTTPGCRGPGAWARGFEMNRAAGTVRDIVDTGRCLGHDAPRTP